MKIEHLRYIVEHHHLSVSRQCQFWVENALRGHEQYVVALDRIDIHSLRCQDTGFTGYGQTINNGERNIFINLESKQQAQSILETILNTEILFI